jgi:hypothetical protein
MRMSSSQQLGYTSCVASLLQLHAAEFTLHDRRISAASLVSSIMVKCALLGCGLFAHDVYARLLKEHGARLHLVAAWSRWDAGHCNHYRIA